MSDLKPMCVKHKDGWCALPAGGELDPRAMRDDTACGNVVIMRIGHQRRRPTCSACIAAMSAPRETMAP